VPLYGVAAVVSHRTPRRSNIKRSQRSFVLAALAELGRSWW